MSWSHACVTAIVPPDLSALLVIEAGGCLRGRLLRVNISNPAPADTWAEVISEHRSDIMMSVLALQVGPTVSQVVHLVERRIAECEWMPCADLGHSMKLTLWFSVPFP